MDEVVVAVAGVAEAGVAEAHRLAPHLLLLLQDLRGPSILIFHLESGQGVKCILNTDEELTSVQNLHPAHGRTSLLQDLRNENLTNSATQTIHL